LQFGIGITGPGLLLCEKKIHFHRKGAKDAKKCKIHYVWAEPNHASGLAWRTMRNPQVFTLRPLRLCGDIAPLP
jgi:hypothetical protein